MKTPALFFSITFLASAAAADGHYSDLFADLGPSGTAQTLAMIENPTPSDQFALGGAHFLSALEGAMQTRYDYGLDDIEMARDVGIPFLGLGIAPNPKPKPFDPTVFEMIFVDALADLTLAHQTLDQITDSDAVAVPIDVNTLWLDINRNAQRDPGEGLVEVAGTQLFAMDASEDIALPSLRFDTADAAWLSAYAHVLSGVSNLILATDVTEAVSKTLSGGATMDALRGQRVNFAGFISDNELPWIDALAAYIVAIEGQPDPARTQAAHANFLNAIEDNKTFWARLDQETDNDGEFIPNERQQSATGIPFPEGIGDSWQAVLADAEAVLKGDLLLPHWRLGDGAGLNYAKLMQDPPEIDIIGLFQGYTLAPYAQKGPVVSFDSLDAFDELTQGNSPLFAVILN